MTKTTRAQYTLEFKQEAVRLVRGGQSIAAAARGLGLVEQTLHNWVKAAPGQAGRHRQEGHQCRANGDQPAASRVGAREDGARHPGKSDGVLRESAELKYAFINRHRRVWPISVQCRVLRVSVAGYHEHFVRRASDAQRRHLSDDALLVHIKAIHAQTHGGYGWPRTWKELVARGIPVGKDRVQKLMQLHGIRAKGKRRFKVTTDSNHALPIAPNLLDRQFTVAEPDRVWAGDITYIHTGEGYRPVQPPGGGLEPARHDAGDRHRCAAHGLVRATRTRRVGIFHSDRGSQYASQEFRDALKEYGITASMSRRGDCWDNACSETLFGSLKVERLHGQKFQAPGQRRSDRLAALVQPGPAALDAGIRQPDAVRAKLACQSTKASQLVTRLWGTDSRGKVRPLKPPPTPSIPTPTPSPR